MPLDSRSANPGGIKTVEEDEERASKTERARRNSRGRHGCWPNQEPVGILSSQNVRQRPLASVADANAHLRLSIGRQASGH